jgi:DNA-directed RNA polymerase
VQFATQVAEHAGVLPTELPEYPALGTLDLNLVLSSPYFFS